MKVKYVILIIPLLAMHTACDNNTIESGVEEITDSIDYAYTAEVEVMFGNTLLMPAEGDDSKFYTEKGFSQLVLSKALHDKTCEAIGIKSEEVQNEIFVNILPDIDIISITVNGVDTLNSNIFLEKLMELTSDSIVQSIIQPINDSLALIDDAIENELSMINEVNLYEHENSKSDKELTKLQEQRIELMLSKSGIIPRLIYVRWGFREL